MTGAGGAARPRVLVVAKTTSYQTYVEEQHDARTTELLARNDPSVRQLLGAYQAHVATVREVSEALDGLGVTSRSTTIATMHEVAPNDFDLVITVGGDGTLLATSHEVGSSTPVLGVNSAPDHSVGFFCGARPGTVRASVEAAIAGTMPRTVLSRMQVDLNGVCLNRRVLNDALFCHEVPAATSRYILTVHRGDGHTLEEDQASSGLWVGPAAGSTAAQRSAGGHILALTSRRIQYVVREPYNPLCKPLVLSRGTVNERGSIVVRCKTRHAKLFLDGPHVDHVVQLGDVVTMGRSGQPLTVLGLSRATGRVVLAPGRGAC
jgi:NAD+ kinase